MSWRQQVLLIVAVREMHQFHMVLQLEIRKFLAKACDSTVIERVSASELSGALQYSDKRRCSTTIWRHRLKVFGPWLVYS